MPSYHIEVGYRTKRGGVAVGMTVFGFDQDEAEEFAKRHILHKHPARKWAFTRTYEAIEADIRLGVFNTEVRP
jgi:hypothetical protein